MQNWRKLSVSPGSLTASGISSTKILALSKKCVWRFKNESLNMMFELTGSFMEYVIQVFKVVKNLVYAGANARPLKKGFFAAFLIQRKQRKIQFLELLRLSHSLHQIYR